jgi:hypothetical protein
MPLALVNMIPVSFSGETNQDSEPNVAVDPADSATIAASAFTLDPDPNATHAPIFVSKDAGATWSLHSIVPFCHGITGDITLRFSSNTHHLYVAYLQTNALGKDIAVARTSDMTFATEMELISTVVSGDQPYVQAATVLTGADTGKDRVYVGYSDGWAQLHYSLDAAAQAPVFKTVKLEARGFQDGISYDLPQVRTAIHPNGVMYVAFQSHRVDGHVDVVVVRDDNWGAGAQPFTALKDQDPGDSKSGQRVVQGVSVDGVLFGQEAGEGELSIAVDPGNAGVVYVAWADVQPETGYTLHVRRSNDHGQTWPEQDELWTIPVAQNPALAVNSEGVVGFLYQQFTNAQNQPRWETHFRYTTGGFQEDLLLAKVPADTPVNMWGTYIGDYIHLMAVQTDFYGVFCANNMPATADFPSMVTYQRKHDFSTQKLLDLDNTTEVPISIDPFFFKVTGIAKRISIIKAIYELSIDPLALLLPSDVYQKMIEKFHPHVPKVADIQAAVRQLSKHERAFVRDRAGAIASRARLVEAALAEMAWD